MVDKTQRAHAANNVLNDETIMAALTRAKADVTDRLLTSTTQEGRENRWQEYRGLERLEGILAKWAAPVRHNQEGNQ